MKLDRYNDDGEVDPAGRWHHADDVAEALAEIALKVVALERELKRQSDDQDCICDKTYIVHYGSDCPVHP